MTVLSKVFGIGAIASTAGIVLWTDQKAKAIPEDRRGLLSERMKEVLSAIPESVRFAYRGEVDLAVRHVSLVASLSSKQYTDLQDRQKFSKEIIKKDSQKDQYIINTIREIHQNHSKKTPIVFLRSFYEVYQRHFTYKSHESFLYSGSIDNLHNKLSREAILSGYYSRCHAGHHLPEIILTEGANCDKFKKMAARAEKIIHSIPKQPEESGI